MSPIMRMNELKTPKTQLSNRDFKLIVKQLNRKCFTVLNMTHKLKENEHRICIWCYTVPTKKSDQFRFM